MLRWVLLTLQHFHLTKHGAIMYNMPTVRHQCHPLHNSTYSTALCFPAESQHISCWVMGSFNHWKQVWEHNPDEVIVMSSGLFQLGLGDLNKKKRNNKRQLLGCSMGNVGCVVFWGLDPHHSPKVRISQNYWTMFLSFLMILHVCHFMKYLLLGLTPTLFHTRMCVSTSDGQALTEIKG